MRLLLRVMFRQGSLLQERFPEIFDTPPAAQLGWSCFGAGMAIIVVGVIEFVNASQIVGILTIVWGGLWMTPQLSPVIIRAWPSRRVPWANVSWAAASVFAFMFPVLIAVAAVFGAWFIFGYALLIQVLFGTGSIRQIEARYLFFFDPIKNKSLVEDIDSGRTGLRRWIEPQIDAYFRLPAAMLRGVPSGDGS